VADARAPRRGRLSRSAEFDKVLRSGRSHAGREFVLYVFPRGGADPPRMGLSVSRKVGGAVERNRVKRVLREAWALESPRLPPGSDAVVIARPDARRLAEEQGLVGVHAALSALVDKVPGVGERVDDLAVDVVQTVDNAVDNPIEAGEDAASADGDQAGEERPA
jgi:ribonuclease P protein component